MKKFLLALALIVPMIAFSGCEGGDDEPDDPNKPNPSDISKITVKAIEGVWTNGDKFISFTDDGFYCTCINDEFIASGTYTIKGDAIKCENAYYGNSLSLNVTKLNSERLRCEINYIDFEGEPESAIVTFTKTDQSPTPKENVLIGKSYVALVNQGGTNKLTYSFDTYNTAEQSVPISPNSAEILRKDMHYVYIKPYVYYQTFCSKTAGLLSFFKYCNTGKVFKEKLTIENGRITNID